MLSAIYTCPAEETAILKDFTLGKFATGALSCTVTVLRGATAYGLLRVDFPLAVSIQHFERWIVLMPGDVLRAVTDTGTCTLWVSGTELEGVAD